jgi:peptidoglycan/LPS O-acetylase OafA/YrhL
VSTPANRLPHIQGLRAVAVLAVVLFHAGLPLPGGFVGVDVFFVISGFVITAMLVRELASAGRIAFGRFYIRRFKRLTPALALTVSVTCIATVLVLSPLGPQQQAGATGIGAMLLLSNYVIASTTGGYFDAPAATNPLLNLWSLSVEEQFYLGFPLLMFLAWSWAQRRGRPAHVRALVGLVGVASFALAVYGSQGVSSDIVTGFYSPFTRAWEFAAGALLALSPQIRWTQGGARVVTLLGMGLLLLSLGEIDGTTPFPGLWTLLPVSASVLLISGGSQGVVGRLLGSRAMVAVGDWSYSIYLWHWPLIVLAGVLFPDRVWVAPLAALVSVVPALLSYRFLEQPIRQREFAPRALAVLVVLTLAVPLALGFGLQALAEHVWKPRAQAAHPAAANAMHAGYVQGCHYEPGDGAKDPVPCVWNPEQSGTPVYLLGDSNAAQFEEAIIDATRSLHRPFTASTTSGCPLLDLEMEGPDFPGYGKACLARNLRLLAWMRSVTPGTVVLAASDDYWFDAGWSVTTSDGVTTSNRTGKIKAMRESLQRAVRSLQRSGHRVILVQTIPHWVGDYAWEPARCTLSSALAGCVQRMPASYETTRTAAVHRAVAEVAAVTGSATVDVTQQVCPDGTCVTVTSGLPVYRDATHITVAMSHRLAPQFVKALQD